MADCDVKRVTGPYFFRMIADQKNSPKLSSPPVPLGSLPKFSMKFFKLLLTLFKTCLVLVPFFGAVVPCCLFRCSVLKEKRNIFSLVRFPEYLICAIVIRFSFIRKMFVTQLFCISPCFDEIKNFAVFFQLNMW